LKLSSRNITLVAIFAALYYVLSLITPYIPAIGLPDIKIQLEALIASVFGFVLGPYLGALAAFLGALITWILPPGSASPFGAPFLLAPPINALIVGLIFYRKSKWAFSLFGLLIGTFFFLPPSQPTPFLYVALAVSWDKIIALLLILPTTKFSSQLSNPKYLPFLFFFISFIGNQADNMWGANIFAVPIVYNSIFGLNLEFVRVLFTTSPFIYPAIRLVQALLATIIVIPLMKSLWNTGWILREKSIIDKL
jgi:uncharacterized membrane protein